MCWERDSRRRQLRLESCVQAVISIFVFVVFAYRRSSRYLNRSWRPKFPPDSDGEFVCRRDFNTCFLRLCPCFSHRDWNPWDAAEQDSRRRPIRLESFVRAGIPIFVFLSLKNKNENKKWTRHPAWEGVWGLPPNPHDKDPMVQAMCRYHGKIIYNVNKNIT